LCPGEFDEAVAQIFALKQNESDEDDNDTCGGEIFEGSCP